MITRETVSFSDNLSYSFLSSTSVIQASILPASTTSNQVDSVSESTSFSGGSIESERDKLPASLRCALETVLQKLDEHPEYREAAIEYFLESLQAIQEIQLQKITENSEDTISDKDFFPADIPAPSQQLRPNG